MGGSKIELLPDAWTRFERAVDVVGKKPAATRVTGKINAIRRLGPEGAQDSPPASQLSDQRIAARRFGLAAEAPSRAMKRPRAWNQARWWDPGRWTNKGRTRSL